MNLRERCQTVFQAGYQFSCNSFRAIAQETNLSKSSVHRLYHRIVNRNQHPESSLWESLEGQKWLRLLVLASIFIFALQGGIGCERLSRFFHLHCLSTRLEKQISRAKLNQSKPEIIFELELKKLILQKSQVSYHNFSLKRNDGTTAAERLFGQQFPDLFEYLVENLGELPQPRKSRKSSKPKTFTLPTVPS